MRKAIEAPTIWRVGFRGRHDAWEGELVAYWEVHLDPMSDSYTPTEISADDLLRRWASEARKDFGNELIPIHWFAESPGQGKFERMPFQYNHLKGVDPEPEDFLSFYSWPTDARTGERLNWFAVPVVDKYWSEQRATKGGFIQEATGWKPSILQPFVCLPTLLSAR